MSSDADDVVNKYYPIYQRNRAPQISFDGQRGVSMSMAPVKAFAEVDKTEDTLFDYSDEDEFVPVKNVPPSPISWPSGDGRGKKMRGTTGSFTQPNLKYYGPYPDFYKVGWKIFFFFSREDEREGGGSE